MIVRLSDEEHDQPTDGSESKAEHEAESGTFIQAANGGADEGEDKNDGKIFGHETRLFDDRWAVQKLESPIPASRFLKSLRGERHL